MQSAAYVSSGHAMSLLCAMYRTVRSRTHVSPGELEPTQTPAATQRAGDITARAARAGDVTAAGSVRFRTVQPVQGCCSSWRVAQMAPLPPASAPPPGDWRGARGAACDALRFGDGTARSCAADVRATRLAACCVSCERSFFSKRDARCCGGDGDGRAPARNARNARKRNPRRGTRKIIVQKPRVFWQNPQIFWQKPRHVRVES